LSYGVIYYWVGYSSMKMECSMSFREGVWHGILWLPRAVCELWMDIPSKFEPFEGVYMWGFILGIIIAIAVGYIVEVIAAILGRNS